VKRSVVARSREKSAMWRKLFVVALLLLACAALWVYTSTTYIIWDGGFDLTVRVSSNPGWPRSVSCQAFGNREDAEVVLDHMLPTESPLGSESAISDPFNGEPLILIVPVSGRESMSGRQLSRFQFRWLVVIGVLQDGRRVGKLVEIPDGRESREVSVVLP
jgi:hypothetical protein